MNWGLALALVLLAAALLVIGWKGTYSNAWQILTGHTTTFGKGAEGSTANTQPLQQGPGAEGSNNPLLPTQSPATNLSGRAGGNLTGP